MAHHSTFRFAYGIATILVCFRRTLVVECCHSNCPSYIPTELTHAFGARENVTRTESFWCIDILQEKTNKANIAQEALGVAVRKLGDVLGTRV
jgi:hypothetical protein